MKLYSFPVNGEWFTVSHINCYPEDEDIVGLGDSREASIVDFNTQFEENCNRLDVVFSDVH